uniref:NADH-ubiquinone oxidoreductase chain 5 n=1 Tax=Proasellus karamani TaxID=1281987 RepID=A0A485M709_9CRUS|nr:NADH dehydrogenase subunit 5 [Proasellus karamani]
MTAFYMSLLHLTSNYSEVLEVPLFSLNSMDILMTFYIDGEGLMFMSFVLAISSAVLLFSGSYMGGDFFVGRFTLLVLLFVLSMGLLITSLNMISLLLGWDGLGVVSYVLVVYYQNEKSNAAGMITALTNRLGDAAILLTIGLLVDSGSWNFMFNMKDLLVDNMWYVGVFVAGASITKSAQMPFSAWLPAAMAAPTPVSALVHSSTLVTAGVYLMIRFNPLLQVSGVVWALALIAFITTFMSSASALWECDLKKIVALSTLSQLGVMVMTLSLGFPHLAMFHLLAHATFKALLFMCSGKIIHSLSDAQDIRSMGGLLSSLPLTSAFFNLANLALCGFPFMAGFYSKDILVEAILMGDTNITFFILMCFMVGLSSAYSVRLTLLSVLNTPSLSPSSSASDEDILISGAYLMLGSLAISSGALLSWTILPTPIMISLPPLLKLLAIAMMSVGAVLGVPMGANLKAVPVLFGEFFMNMWLLPNISGAVPSKGGFKLSAMPTTLDLGWAELVGGKGGHLVLTRLSAILPKGVFTPTLSFQLLGILLIVIFAISVL